MVSSVLEIAPADSLDAARRTDEAFLEILCADEDLLRAEFESIIAKEWPSPPSDVPLDHPTARQRPPWAGRGARAGTAERKRSREPAVEKGARQRSPPVPGNGDTMNTSDEPER